MSRKSLIFYITLCALTLFMGALVASAQSAAPAIFYSDLPSGPNTGGENNNGAIVTIYGKGFGNSQGSSSITVGGAAVAGYKSWSDTKVAFAVGSGAKSGNIVINVGGQTSNGTPFTVRGGTISCGSAWLRGAFVAC